MQCVNNTSCSQEEQCLEEGVGGEMEHGTCERAGTQGHEHESKLAHRRIGQYFFDVVLQHRNATRHQGCGDSNHGDDRHRNRRKHEKQVGTGNHVYSCRHHRGRVNQS